MKIDVMRFMGFLRVVSFMSHVRLTSAFAGTTYSSNSFLRNIPVTNGAKLVEVGIEYAGGKIQSPLNADLIRQYKKYQEMYINDKICKNALAFSPQHGMTKELQWLVMDTGRGTELLPLFLLPPHPAFAYRDPEKVFFESMDHGFESHCSNLEDAYYYKDRVDCRLKWGSSLWK
jgi:hypothetical protein